MKKKLLIIGGPTAVGKTKLGIECAKIFNGKIISSDCEQIYKHLNIGSAKPTENELKQAKHYMIDIKEPNEDFSVGEFKEKSQELIEAILSQNKLPIIVGGTGLYIKALLFPYTFSSSTKSEEIRAKYKLLAERFGNEYIYEILKKVDENSAKKLHYNDIKRVIRALEIYETTGVAKSNSESEVESEYDYKLIFLSDDREILYERINNRVEKMFEDGLEIEVKNLIKTYKLNRDSHSMQGIGYREFFDYFENKITLCELKEKIKQDSRNYAKRQITWFKHMKNSNEYSIKNIDKIVLDVNKWLKSDNNSD